MKGGGVGRGARDERTEGWNGGRGQSSEAGQKEGVKDVTEERSGQLARGSVDQGSAEAGAAWKQKGRESSEYKGS